DWGAGGDEPQQWELDGSNPRASRDHLDRTAAVPGSFDEALLLQVRQVLMDRGERGEPELVPDFLEAWRVSGPLNELVQVVENLTLPFCEREHRPSSRPGESICKGKAKIKQIKP